MCIYTHINVYIICNGKCTALYTTQINTRPSQETQINTLGWRAAVRVQGNSCSTVSKPINCQQFSTNNKLSPLVSKSRKLDAFEQKICNVTALVPISLLIQRYQAAGIQSLLQGELKSYFQNETNFT